MERPKLYAKEKPEYVYSVHINQEGPKWIPYFYNIDNAINKAIELVEKMGYSKDDMYWDCDGESEHLIVSGVPDKDDPDLTDSIMASINPWLVEDFNED